jgi:uncharacterized membrane protein YfcA
MGLEIICGLIVLIFTTILAMAGIGAAFIFIPIFFWLGIPLEVAIPTGLFLNGLGLTAASIKNIKNKLVPFKIAVPIAIVSLITAPFGAYSSKYIDRSIILWLFAFFLIFSGCMILFYTPKHEKKTEHSKKDAFTGIGIGGFVGYLSGLLGVGGGGIISPTLIYLGHKPKKVAAATAFIVPFSSYSGFITYLNMGHVQTPFLIITGIGAILGSLIGTWLMNDKLKSDQVKLIIGIVIIAVALKIIYGLLC